MAIIAMALLLPVSSESQPVGQPGGVVRLVVAYPPGGTADAIARIMSEPMSKALARPVIVENRPGANGNIAAEQVAKSSLDSLQLLVTAPGPLAVNASLYSSMQFDPKNAFTPITRVANAPLVLVVSSGLPVTNMKELLAYAAAHPEKATFASQGNASSGHLAMEMLKARTGMKAVHVPYKGGAPAVTDLIAGHVTMMFDNVSSSLPHIRSGALRAIAVAEASRLSVLPNVPTAIESGVNGFTATPWFGIVAKSGISAATMNSLGAAIHQTLESTAVRMRFAEMALEPVTDTPSAFASFIAAERDKWSDVIRSSGIRAE